MAEAFYLMRKCPFDAQKGSDEKVFIPARLGVKFLCWLDGGINAAYFPVPDCCHKQQEEQVERMLFGI